MRIKIIIYRDKKKDFCWRMVAANGKIVAESGEGYARIGGLLKSLRGLIEYCQDCLFLSDEKLEDPNDRIAAALEAAKVRKFKP